MGQRLRSDPLTLYREEKGRLEFRVGTHYQPRVPRSWSLIEKPMMGETTLITTSVKGTCVAVLSPYAGEEEVISFHEPGYVVTSVEEHQWAGRPSRRVVRLEELP
jgi:hypothetical protein